MASVTADKLISDAKKVAGRLKDRTVLSDSLIMEAEYVNEHLENLHSAQDNFEALNKLARNVSNNEMINAINQEHPHMRDIQMQNRELRSCLQDYQRALEHIMSKYREHTQKKILNSKITFNYQRGDDNKFSNRYVDKILEMVAVMRHAANGDDDLYDREQETLINKLVTENKGLREMLQISRDYGSIALSAPTEEKASQTDDLNMNDSDLFNSSSVSSVLGNSQMSVSDTKQQEEQITTNHINNNHNNTNTTSSTFTSSVNINVKPNHAAPPTAPPPKSSSSSSSPPPNSAKANTADAAS